LFGRARVSRREVQCTNPAALGGGTRPLLTAAPADEVGLFALVNDPSVTTNVVAYHDLLTAHCEQQDGFRRAPGRRRAQTGRHPAPRSRRRSARAGDCTSGTANIAIDNLVDIVCPRADADTRANG
jgi:hypothetical protein